MFSEPKPKERNMGNLNFKSEEEKAKINEKTRKTFHTVVITIYIVILILFFIMSPIFFGYTPIIPTMLAIVSIFFSRILINKSKLFWAYLALFLPPIVAEFYLVYIMLMSFSE